MNVFRQVIVIDFEFEIEPGNLPVVLCMVAYMLDENLQHVRTIRLWQGGFDREPPFPIDHDTLIVAYSAWAEMTCFMVLGWNFPIHIFDLHTAYLASSNNLLPYAPDEPRKKIRKRLPDACRAYDIAGWEHIDKNTMAEDIGNGLWRKYGQAAVFEYCEEDVKKSAQLLRRQHRGNNIYPPVDVPCVLYWSNYSAKTIARVQARGMPIDMELWNLVQENKAAVIGELIRQLDPSYGSEYPIYTPEAEWSYERFEQYLIYAGVTRRALKAGSLIQMAMRSV